MTQRAALPANETSRLASLHALNVLDTETEAIFDQITQLAADLCGVPIALVSLIDAQRQWFKSSVGLPGARETHRDLSFCAHAILGEDLMEVQDATLDVRFASNPVVAGAPAMRFYAGVPIATSPGERVGTLCVIDRVARRLTPEQRTALTGLSRMVATALLERKRRLELTRELAATEAKYRFIVEGQSDLVSLASPAGRLTFVNLAYAEFCGVGPQDMIGRQLLDFVAEHDRDVVMAHLRRVCDEGVVATSVNRMVCASGQERWVSWTNRALPAQLGQPVSIHSVGRDITEQKLAEKALALTEARNRLLYEATPAMLHSIDPKGRLMDVSDTWLANTGYRREQVLGRAAIDFLTPESARRARETVQPALFRTGRCDEIDYQVVRKDGSVFDVLVSAVIERDANGEPIRSLSVMTDVTNRKATAASLAETTHMLQLVLDNLPARVSYWDAANRNRFANKAFLEEFGVTQNDIIGRHVREIVGEAWFARIERNATEGLAGQHGQLEAEYTVAAGARRHVDLRFTPDFHEGRVNGLFVIALDVTAQREAERELADRDRRFKLLVEGVRDYAIYMLDAKGRVTTWNAGAERNKGYSAEEVIGQHVSKFFTPEDVARGKPDSELVLAARDGRFETEDWRVRGDGRKFWASVLLSAIYDDHKELIGYTKITRDLTERRRQQDLLVRAVELSPSAMVLIDAAGVIVMVNAQTESIFGYARAELLGQPLELLIPARSRALHPQLRQGFMRIPTVRRMGAGRELQGLHKDGHEFPVEVGLSPIESADGPGALAAIFDITDRRRQQAAIELALAEKETLLKEVYHRVKNNLQVVQSLLNLQRQALPEGVARAAVDDSVQRVRAMALVHEKLYQSGNLAAVSLAEYTRDLMSQIAEAHGAVQRRVKLHTNIADVQTGLDNAVPFGLLLTELVTNCLKHAFTDQRSGDVWVSLVRQAEGHLLTVEDNGVGLAGGFDPAAQTASMGLQLAQGLARQLGGHLCSRTGAGAVLFAVLTRL